MLLIGLCGGSGAGKGTVAELFLKHGIPSIDADAVYRDLTAPGSRLPVIISKMFGEQTLTPDGGLNRKKLAEIVFSDKEKLKNLNLITHAEIITETERRLKKYKAEGYPALIFDAPQLFESGFNKRCDVIISVVAPLETRIERLLSRDGITEEAARKRISSQLSDDYIMERSDFVIVNDGDMEYLRQQTDELVKILLK